MAIPVDVGRALHDRRERWPESLGLTILDNGQFAYVGRDGAE